MIEILDAKKVSTTNSNFLWMIRTSIQFLCPSILPNWAHDGGTVIGVHLPLESIHTHDYLPRKTDNTATCVIATLPSRREKASRRKPPSLIRHKFKEAKPSHHKLGLVTNSRSRTALPCFAFIGTVSPRLGRKNTRLYRNGSTARAECYAKVCGVISGYSGTCDGIIHSALQTLGEVEIRSHLRSSRAYSREESTLWTQFLVDVNRLFKESCYFAFESSSSRRLDTSA